MNARVLVVDDDAGIRTVVREALRREGYAVELAATLDEADAAARRAPPDLVVTDVALPDGDALDELPRLRGVGNAPVIVLSARNTLTTAVRATERGAFEYLPKPFDLAELGRAAAAALASTAPAPAAAEKVEELPLVGRSPAMQDVYRTVARVVPSDLTVLLLGESGTGKELVARAIHDHGARRAAPFVAVNMAAIPRELIESELFGHERGAFTGAHARAAGRFAQAMGGTLFLDEIGDMPAQAQTRLLRVLQSGEFTPVGSARPVRADVRVIAATHQDLPALIGAGAFREDLYYRLNVVPVRLPALRRRREDLPELVAHFLDRAAGEGLPRKRVSPAALDALRAHDWPGNVRELENLVRRLCVLGRDPVIGAEAVAAALAGEGGSIAAPSLDGMEEAIDAHLSALLAGAPPPDLYEHMLARLEAPLLRRTLEHVGGNQLRAAALLGINRNTLRKKLLERGVLTRPGRG